MAVGTDASSFDEATSASLKLPNDSILAMGLKPEEALTELFGEVPTMLAVRVTVGHDGSQWAMGRPWAGGRRAVGGCRAGDGQRYVAPGGQ